MRSDLPAQFVGVNRSNFGGFFESFNPSSFQSTVRFPGLASIDHFCVSIDYFFMKDGI